MMDLLLYRLRLGVLLIIIAVGFYDYYSNSSVTSLVSAVILLLFLIGLYRTRTLPYYNRVFGITFIALAFWGLTEDWLKGNEVSMERVVMYSLVGVLGLLLATNKLFGFIRYIENKKILKALILLGGLAYLYYIILGFPDTGIMEVLILAAATILTVLMILPERKI